LLKNTSILNKEKITENTNHRVLSYSVKSIKKVEPFQVSQSRVYSISMKTDDGLHSTAMTIDESKVQEVASFTLREMVRKLLEEMSSIEASQKKPFNWLELEVRYPLPRRIFRNDAEGLDE
jgi:hypothetical protein